MAIEPEQQPLTPQKQNLLLRLVAEYKEILDIRKRARAGGTVSPEERKKLDEKMRKIRNTARIAGIATSFAAAIAAIALALSKPSYETEESSTLLFNAIRLRNPDQIRNLLVQGTDPNVKNSSGDTPLHIVAKEYTKDDKVVEVINILLQYRANPNEKNHQDHTPLYYATKRGLSGATGRLMGASIKK